MSYNAEIADRLCTMFGTGETVAEVCLALGINQETFDEWKTKYPEFNHAAEMGEIIAQAYHEDLLLNFMQGNIDLDHEQHMKMMNERYTHDYPLSMVK